MAGALVAATGQAAAGPGPVAEQGGRRASSLVGTGGNDILIGGCTSYAAARCAVTAVWTSADTFAQRVAYLSDQHHSYFLVPDVTVFKDSSKDTLNGGSGGDWLFA